MASKKEASSLVDYFDLQYQSRYGRVYKGNRPADVWGFLDIINDIGFKRAKLLIDYYFRLKGTNDHSRTWFTYHYNELDNQLEDLIRDALHRKQIRKDTQARMEAIANEA